MLTRLSSQSSLHSYSLSSSRHSLSRVSDSALCRCHSNNDDSASVNRRWDSVIQEVLRNAVKKFDLSLFGGFSISLSPESAVRKGQGKKQPTWRIFSLKWNKLIQKPFEEGDERGLKLVQSILRPIMLRMPILILPPADVQVIYCELTEAEKDFYEALFRRSKVKFDQFVEQGRVLHNYASILELLLRLRQCCDHPFLVMRMMSDYKVEKFSVDFHGLKDSIRIKARLIPRGTQALGKDFPASTPRLIQGFSPSLMAPKNC